MVDLAVLQTVSYLIAALSFAVTCAYYIMNLRNTQKNMEMTLETRRINIINSLTSYGVSPDGMKVYFEILNYKWTDYDDFERKYGSNNNMEAHAKRNSIWAGFNVCGAMLRKGQLKTEDLYDIGMQGAIWIWAKYKPIIEEYRIRYNGRDWMRDFEYLAKEMMKVKLERDPSFKLPGGLGANFPD